ncbi:ABC transporter substrate-binding protein [Bradyrhizobium sp. 14AA]
MLKRLVAATFVAMCFAPLSSYGDTVKVGIIAPFSGPYSHYGQLFKAGVETYLASQGGKFDGHEIELIFRDTGGPNPTLTRSLAQELIIKDKVSYLGGFVFTPNAVAVAPLIQQAKIPTVIFNAGTQDIVEKSDYYLRTSYTLRQVTVPLSEYLAQSKINKMLTVVADYAPGVDAESAFKQSFTAAGGAVLESIRIPLSTTDFAPFMQRIKASGAQGVYVFFPGGPPTLGFVKSYVENGVKEAGVQLYGTAEADEFDLPKFGDGAVGITTSYYYAASHESPLNQKFIADLKAYNKDVIPNYAAASAWDGMRLIHRMVSATAGKRDGEGAIAAAKGFAWESPRGQVSIDPATRHVNQTVWLRTIEKNDEGKLVNREVKSLGVRGASGELK